MFTADESVADQLKMQSCVQHGAVETGILANLNPQGVQPAPENGCPMTAVEQVCRAEQWISWSR